MERSEESKNPDEPYSWEFLLEVYDYRWQAGERRELFFDVERLYDAKSRAISEELDAALAASDPELHGDVVGDFVGEIRYTDHELPSIQRAATFIMLIHFAEARLASICEGISRELNTQVRLKDFRRSGIDPAISFLKKYSQLDLIEVTSEFAFLLGCKHLRNALVHNGGLVAESNTVTAKFVANESTLDGQSTGEIYVTAALVVKLLDCLERIFVGIHTAMESFMRKAGNAGHVFLIGEMGRVPFFGPDPQGPNAR